MSEMIGKTLYKAKVKAIDYLVIKLKRSIKLGKKYVKKEESLLEDAILFLEP